MRKNLLLLFSCIAISTITFAQQNTASGKKMEVENIYTALKPLDGQGAVFNTKEELDAKVQDKKDKTIALIKENANDPVKVKTYREQLWRFENAIIQAPKTN
jgi:hypothetical protein